jgi:lysozyme family protein
MMGIPEIINGIIGKEGGYSNNPNDAGGETMWGITLTTARAEGYMGPMKEMPRSTAEAIYARRYVTRPGFDKVAAVNVRIAEEMVDTGVNMGTSLPGPWLQKILNALNQQGKLWPDLEVDGAIGPATLSALKSLLKQRGKDGETIVLRALNCLQGARYIEITESRPANETFFAGWLLNRVEVA